MVDASRSAQGWYSKEIISLQIHNLLKKFQDNTEDKIHDPEPLIQIHKEK